LILAGCGDKQPEVQAPTPTVEVASVVQKTVPVQEEWVGTLDGMVNAQINAQVTGYLIKQNYKEGDLVKKGQLLYQIDPRTFQAAVDEAKSTLARQEALLKTARLDLDRIKRLLPEKAVSVRDRDNAEGREASTQAEVLAARAAYEKAQLELGFTKITAPIDGIAGISKAQLGDLVGPSSSNAELTTVSQVDPIKAYIPLSEQQYLRFAKAREDGDKRGNIPIELILSNGDVYPHGGTVLFADRQVDVNTGTIKLAIAFPNPTQILRPGLFARIRAVVTEKPGALLIPQRAVNDLQGKSLVAVVQPDNTVAMRMVKPGVRIGSLWVIDEGLKPGDRVIVEGAMKVKEGMKVETKPFVEAPPAGKPSPKAAG
jgi:membrane fusion protein (multidrug efflux system)